MYRSLGKGKKRRRGLGTRIMSTCTDAEMANSRLSEWRSNARSPYTFYRGGSLRDSEKGKKKQLGLHLN